MIGDGPHAFCDGMVLQQDAGNPRIGLGALHFTVNHVVVVHVLLELVSSIPAGGVGQAVEIIAAGDGVALIPIFLRPVVLLEQNYAHGVLVVHGDIAAQTHVGVHGGERWQGEAGKEEVRHAPVEHTRLFRHRPVGAVDDPVVGVLIDVFRRPVGHGGAEGGAAEIVVRYRAKMQEAEMGSVDITFQGLQPVAAAHLEIDHHLFFRH